VPGFALKEVSEIDQIRNLLPPPSFQRHTHLVLSCNHRDLDAYEMMQRYQITKFDDLIVTKLDESFTHGLIYNLQRRTEKPLFAFGIGPKIPEDIEMATRERVVDLIFKISKMTK
jgi:flagellar biosynthesis protein FlhF